MFYLELISLGAEITGAIRNRLKTAASNALKYESKIIDNALRQNIDNIDEVIYGLRNIAQEGAGSSKFILKARHFDDFGSFGNVRKIEEGIKKEVIEYGAFFDDKGKLLASKFTDNSKISVDIPNQIELITRRITKRVFTHNHPKSSPISAFDIQTFIKLDLQELRAVCADGSIFAIKKKGKLPSSEEDYREFILRVLDRVKSHKDYSKWANGDESARFKLDELVANAHIDELGDSVEYIKYQ